MTIRFVLGSSGGSFSTPTVRLKKQSWDDYGWSTLFSAQYLSANTNAWSMLGYVKILQRESRLTRLPDHFERLNDQFCALGQSYEFYETVSSLGEEISRAILSGLRDVTFNPGIYDAFREEEGFETSLLRDSEASALLEARRKPQSPTLLRSDSRLKFEFTCRTPGAFSDHRVALDFRDDGLDLARLAVFVGRNGTGKTQVLAQMAYALSGYKTREKDEPEQFRDAALRPPFSSIIAVSYSAFDVFEIPKSIKQGIAYKYCGIRKPSSGTFNAVKEPTWQVMNVEDMQNAIRTGLSEITARDRLPFWRTAVQTLIEPPDALLDGLLRHPERRKWGAFNRLSAGHRLIVLAITEILRHIEPNSLVLLDEPETHLHPELLSAFISTLRGLLREFDSYAIIATHSAIVVQEVPARQVTVFDRVGNEPILRPLAQESFGENLSALTDFVFGLNRSQQNYRAELRRLAAQRSYDDVIGKFNSHLSLNARMYLDALKLSDGEE